MQTKSFALSLVLSSSFLFQPSLLAASTRCETHESTTEGNAEETGIGPYWSATLLAGGIAFVVDFVRNCYEDLIARVEDSHKHFSNPSSGSSSSSRVDLDHFDGYRTGFVSGHLCNPVLSFQIKKKVEINSETQGQEMREFVRQRSLVEGLNRDSLVQQYGDRQAILNLLIEILEAVQAYETARDEGILEPFHLTNIQQPLSNGMISNLRNMLKKEDKALAKIVEKLLRAADTLVENFRTDIKKQKAEDKSKFPLKVQFM